MARAAEPRTPDFAGSWYPGDPERVRAQLAAFAEQAQTPRGLAGPLRGGIVPHAGWVFSGAIAYGVLSAIAESGAKPAVMVVFGKHMGPDDRPTIMRRGSWSTPLGELRIAEELADALCQRFDFEEETALRYEPDNTIELQLPFVKALFPDARLLPIGAPARAQAMDLGRTVAELASEQGVSFVAVGSTDLTHYGMNYGFAPKGYGPEAERWVREVNDRGVVEALTALKPADALTHARANRSACCAGAAIAASAAAIAAGATKGELLRYATSNDVRPGGSSFVGYAGIVFG